MLSRSVLTEHARKRLVRRGIPVSLVLDVLETPDSQRLVGPGRILAQALRSTEPFGKPMLVRIFVDIDRNPPEVVTVYVTSKISKYTGSQ